MTENIFLFVPNIIGYGRIILALLSFYFMPTNCLVASICYGVSAFLDCIDGHAARMFNQSTKFGAMLDQLTDRCGTMCLLVILAQFYPSYTFWFQLSMAIDVASHWLHLHTSLLSGKDNHKNLDANDNPIMKLYYTNKPILFTMCVGNEAFYGGLYLLHFTEGPLVLGLGLFRAMTLISAPIAIAKSLVSLLQMQIAAVNLGTIDVTDRSKRTE
ncbi:CDP-diacylglycerol--inositol 3-phosphatidyltransferase [Dermacentor andersoni]|uniref:CDP-diacylglycerol--inositol 3-phosphatidyltransferase n=1 Tax=Dermacentor andersoni TaxID=34620 RepID=UPI00215509FC|nr:CDP-diacylglycerol--inositol 3-phosphatidyltransferase-like [Dermacentor andersoni]